MASPPRVSPVDTPKAREFGIADGLGSIAGDFNDDDFNDRLPPEVLAGFDK